VSFAFSSFFIGLLLTFPYDTLKKIMTSQADAAGYELRIKSLGPGFGLVARGIFLSKKSSSPDTPPSEPLSIDSVSLRPSLFPPGVALTADLMEGEVSTSFTLMGNSRMSVKVSDIDFSKGNFKGFSGVDVMGSVNGEMELSTPMVAVGKGPKEADLGASQGLLKLNLEGVQVNGGSIKVVIPAYGSEPTPVDLPKLDLGDMNASVKIEKGVATEMSGSGTVKLAKRLQYSELALEVRTKVTPEFQNSLGVYGMAFSQMRPDPKDSAWRLSRLTGYLGRPSFR
jgi:type II secretion system protein N